ncbi:MAG TPA: FHA domain-containing protein [Solirubrobacteraceae bacterium]|nr:FHA domain-containing protein [Solirubrobacteraceae bacterium]
MSSGTAGRTASSDELRVEVVAGKATGFSFVVDSRLVIGRTSEGPGRLADDPELSRHHAEIVRAPNGEFTINDLSSTNGTFVNGTRLNAAAVLVIGDQIEVGATKLVVRSAPVAPAPARAEVDVRAATVIGGVPEAARRPGDETHAQTEPQAPTGGEPVTVQLTVDFEQATAQLSVHGSGEPVQLVLDHGRWRVVGGGS